MTATDLPLADLRADAERWKRSKVATRILLNDSAIDAADALLALVERVEQAEAERVRFAARLGFGDDVNEPAATLEQMVDPIEQAFHDARDHGECAVICELCGDPLATHTCERCHGSGCLPNAALAYLECDECAGVGKVHPGCREASYSDLAATVARLTADLDAERAKVAAVESREWSAAFLDEWKRPYFGEGRRDAVAAVQRAVRAALAVGSGGGEHEPAEDEEADHG